MENQKKPLHLSVSLLESTIHHNKLHLPWASIRLFWEIESRPWLRPARFATVFQGLMSEHAFAIIEDLVTTTEVTIIQFVQPSIRSLHWLWHTNVFSQRWPHHVTLVVKLCRNAFSDQPSIWDATSMLWDFTWSRSGELCPLLTQQTKFQWYH